MLKARSPEFALLKRAVASTLLVLGSSPVALAEALDLGTVQSSGGAGGETPGFFAGAPDVTTGRTPPAQQRKIQQFNPNATGAETTITRGQYEQTQPTDSFTGVLRDMPNVITSSSGDSMDGEDVYINGFGKQLINFTLDGVPLNDKDSYAFYTNEFIPVPLVAGTKFYPGAESAAIPGLSAFGGSVETYSLNPSPYFFVRPMLGAGSFGKHNYGGLINSGLLFKGIAPTSAWVYANQVERDGYFQNNGSIQNQFLFKSVSQIGPGALTLFFSQNNQRFNYYNGATAAQRAQFGDDYNSYNNDPTSPFYTGYNYNQYLDWLSYAKYEGAFARVKFSEQYYFYRGKGFGAGATSFATTLLTPAGTVSKVTPAKGAPLLRNSINNTNRWGNILKLLFPLGPVQAESGFWFDHNSTDHSALYYFSNTGQYAGASYLEPVATDVYEPYVNFSARPLQALRISAGLKFLYAQRRFRDDIAGKTLSSSFRSWLPSLGVNYHVLPKWSVYANFTRNANPPQYNQYYSGVFNPDLQPQEAYTYDLGTHWDTGFWSGGLNLFRVDFQNYILSTTVQVGSYNQKILSNGNAAINQGLAWQNNFVLTDWLSSYLNLGLLDARLKSQDQPLPYAPHHTESAGLIVRDSGFTGRFGLNEVGNAYYLLGSQYLPLGSRVYADASARYTFRYAPLSSGLGFKDLTLALYVNNLFDRRYIQSYSGSSTNPNMKLNLPLNFYATLEARF